MAITPSRMSIFISFCQLFSPSLLVDVHCEWSLTHEVFEISTDSPIFTSLSLVNKMSNYHIKEVANNCFHK